METALAQWVPPPILVGIIFAILTAMLVKFDRLLDKILSRLELLEQRSHTYATNDMLGRLGDRLDGRVTNVAERVAVIEALGRRRDDDSQ